MGEILSNAVTNTIFERRSIRSYQDRMPTQLELDTILEAGIWAPTARNQQETDFYVLRDRNIINEISEKYSAYAKKNEVQDISFGAPVLILLYAKTDARFRDMDAGITAENMAIAAQSLGLGSLFVGCFREFMLSEEGLAFSKSIGVPEGYTFCVGLAVGYPVNTTKALPRRENRIFYI